MFRRRLSLQAVTKAERQGTLEAVKQAINSVGHLVDFTLFSNIAASFRFEVPAGALDRLAAAFGTLDIRLDSKSDRALAEAATQAPRLTGESAQSEVPGTLAITFVHDDPDLRRKMPVVPG